MKMTPRQTAKYLRCSVAIVYSLCQSKRLAHYRVGNGRGKILIATEDADAYLASTRVATIVANNPVVKPPPVKLIHLRL